MTINKKTRKKKIRNRKHSTGDKTLDKLARGYLIIKNAVMSNKSLMDKVNLHLSMEGRQKIQVNYALLNHHHHPNPNEDFDILKKLGYDNNEDL